MITHLFNHERVALGGATHDPEQKTETLSR
jgi:hypothetical protein